MSDMNPSPFVKWAGGKARLLSQYEPFLPAHFEGYIEPFVGGGALFFHLKREGRLAGGRMVLMDRLEELVNCYLVIQTQVDALIGLLREHEPHKRDAEYYYRVRSWDRIPGYALRDDVERAARFLFLNRVCYNGLYRVNRRGQFNVPFGRHRNPTVCDDDNLLAVHDALQGVVLSTSDFENCVDWAKRGDFVYFDPPYHPLSTTAGFTSYTQGAFDSDDQRRLAQVFSELDRRGCKVMLSNSDTELIRDLYAGFKLVQVFSSRPISAKANGRGSVPELLILNDYRRVESG
jgi:DNA adenine methylase